MRIVPGVAPRARHHLGHVALGDQARVQHQARLQRRQRNAVDPQGRHVIGIELLRQHDRQFARRGLAEAVDQRRVGVAHTNFEDGLIQCPGRVHLHVRFLDRRHRAEGVDTRHEGEGRSLQVVATAGAHEIHILGVVEADLFKGARQHRHDQFHLVDGAGVRDSSQTAGKLLLQFVSLVSPPSR